MTVPILRLPPRACQTRASLARDRHLRAAASARHKIGVSRRAEVPVGTTWRLAVGRRLRLTLFLTVFLLAGHLAGPVLWFAGCPPACEEVDW